MRHIWEFLALISADIFNSVAPYFVTFSKLCDQSLGYLKVFRAILDVSIGETELLARARQQVECICYICIFKEGYSITP